MLVAASQDQTVKFVDYISCYLLPSHILMRFKMNFFAAQHSAGHQQPNVMYAWNERASLDTNNCDVNMLDY